MHTHKHAPAQRQRPSHTFIIFHRRMKNICLLQHTRTDVHRCAHLQSDCPHLCVLATWWTWSLSDYVQCGTMWIMSMITLASTCGLLFKSRLFMFLKTVYRLSSEQQHPGEWSSVDWQRVSFHKKGSRKTGGNQFSKPRLKPARLTSNRAETRYLASSRANIKSSDPETSLHLHTLKERETNVDVFCRNLFQCTWEKQTELFAHLCPWCSPLTTSLFHLKLLNLTSANLKVQQLEGGHSAQTHHVGQTS